LARGDDSLRPSSRPTDRLGAVVLTATLNGSVVHQDEVRISLADDRDRFGAELCRLMPGLDPVEVTKQLLEVAARYADRAAGGDPEVQYFRTPRGIAHVKYVKGEEVVVHLTNFDAVIVEEVVHDDGAERQRHFEIEAKLFRRTHRFVVSSADFQSMSWVLRELGAGAVIHAGFTIRDRVRAAIQLLSGDPPARVTYGHTGWRRIGDEWVYLHSGGGIGPDGSVAGLDTVLPSALQAVCIPPPPAGEALIRCVNASLRMLELGPDEIVFPPWCAVWRSILGGADFSVFLVGPSGSFKTALEALCQQHFGERLSAERLPASWSGTENALEVLAFAAKGCLIAIDDFAPADTNVDVQRLHMKAERVLRAQGNHSGRHRLRAEGDLRPVKPPRGLILSTGEELPHGHSLRARLVAVEIADGDIRQDVLDECQRHAAAGDFALAMSAFIQWLAPHMDRVPVALDRITRATRASASGHAHRRTPSNIAGLLAGLRFFCRFAVHTGALSPAAARSLRQRGSLALDVVARLQRDHHGSDEPVEQFLNLIRSAVTSGKAHLAGVDGDRPLDPLGWGWRCKTVGSGAASHEEWDPRGDRVGWIHGQDIYLDAKAAYLAATRMAVSGDGLTISCRMLQKRLKEKGLLASTDQGKLQVRRVIESQRRYVLHLQPYTLWEKPDQPGHPLQEATENGKTADERPPPWSAGEDDVDRIGPSKDLFGGRNGGFGPNGPDGPVFQ
jgi:hypothetical protein